MKISAFALTFGVLAATAVAPAVAATKEEKQAKALAELMSTYTIEHFQQTADVKDSDLDLKATITTRNGFQEKRGLFGLVNDDVLLRVFIDKKTGQATYQVYATIYYSGDWRYYQSVNYTSFGVPEQVALDVIDRDVNGCTKYGCTFAEVFAFTIDEEYLRKMAAVYDPAQLKIWKMRFNAKDGSAWETGMMGAEIVGCLKAVDAYRTAHGLPHTAPPVSTEGPKP